MPFFKIFSERQKHLRGEVLDVYQYETIPPELRVQIIYIWETVFGKPIPQLMGGLSYPKAYEVIHEDLCFRYGKFSLSEHYDFAYESVRHFFLETEDTEKAIDVIELSFRYIDQYVRSQIHNQRISPDDAIAILNNQFREHRVGYQYKSGQIIRVDSEFIHSEAIKPALIMLSDPMYEGANAEFLSAHQHYRTGKYKECLNDCLKAVESCIKAICDTRGWGYNDGDTISPLIAIIFMVDFRIT